MKVTDEKGLVLENQILTIIYPFENAITPFRVVTRNNHGYEDFEYGPIPYTASGHSSGVVPSRSYTSEFTFSYSRLQPESAPDMFYFTDKNKIYHTYITFQPAYLLRVFRRIPKGTTTMVFRTVTPSPSLSLDIEFGFSRGTIEQVFLPHIQIGWFLANPTNIDLRTNVHITYGDYDVEFIDKPEIVWDIMKGKLASHQVVFGGITPVPERTMNLMLEALNAKLIKIQPLWLPDSEAVENIRRDLGV